MVVKIYQVQIEEIQSVKVQTILNKMTIIDHPERNKIIIQKKQNGNLDQEDQKQRWN